MLLFISHLPFHWFHISTCGIRVASAIDKRMALRKGFSPFSRIVSEDLSPNTYWCVLSAEICGGSPLSYFKQSPLVASFPEEFHRSESDKLWLEDGSAFIDKKTSNGFEVVCTSFGLVSTVVHRKMDVKEKLPVAFHKIKDFLNGLTVEDVTERPIAAQRLEMPPRFFQYAEVKRNAEFTNNSSKQWWLA